MEEKNQIDKFYEECAEEIGETELELSPYTIER